MAITRKISTRDRFIKWLMTQPKGTRFDRRNPCNCPLASYSGAHISGSGFYHDRHGEEPTFQLPAWARRFVHAWDWGRGVNSKERKTLDGTARQALNLMLRQQGG